VVANNKLVKIVPARQHGIFRIVDSDDPGTQGMPRLEFSPYSTKAGSDAMKDLRGAPPGLYHKKCVAISSDGEYVAAGRPGQNLVVYQTRTGVDRAVYFPRNIESVAFTGSHPVEIAIADDRENRWIYRVVMREEAAPKGRAKTSRTRIPRV